MNIVIGLVIVGVIFYCFIYIKAQNELRSEKQAISELVRSEEERETLYRIESLIVDLHSEARAKNRTDQERLLEDNKEIIRKIQRIEGFLVKDLSDDDFDSYMAQEDYE